MDPAPTVLTFMRVAPGTSRSLDGTHQAMLSALCANANRLAVTGVANCRTALDLAERVVEDDVDGVVEAHVRVDFCDDDTVAVPVEHVGHAHEHDVVIVDERDRAR